MDIRSFDRNSVRLQLPKAEKQLPREECLLKANDEEDQPLLRSRQPNGHALQNSKMTRESTKSELRVPRLAIPQKKRTLSVSGLVASNDFFIPGPLTATPTSAYHPAPSCTGRDTRIRPQTPRTPMAPRTAMTSRVSSLTPRTPRTPRFSLMTPRTPRFSLMTPRTPRDTLMTPRTPRKEVLADSLRGQFTPRNSSKAGVDFGRKGNWAGGFLGRAIRGRDWFQRPSAFQSASNTTDPEAATDLEKKLQEQGLTPVYCPEPLCDNRLRLGNVASMIADLRVFLTRPVPEDLEPIECHIRRQVHAKWLTPSYRLYLTEGDRFLLASKKKKKTKTSYTISLDEHDISKQSGNYFGKLCSNFVGSEYWFYDKGAPPVQAAGVCGAARLPTAKNRVEMGAVKYHVNVLGIAGPRRMTAIMPSLQDDGKPHVFPAAADGGPVILDDYRCGQHRDKMIIMHNKQPRFNKQIHMHITFGITVHYCPSACSTLVAILALCADCALLYSKADAMPKLAAYCLNFNGRVTKPSVKNFQLVADSDQDTVILQFGKIGRNLFAMDYQHPMSALQAFSICLSSLDPKIACE